jgi:hypothetical protein
MSWFIERLEKDIKDIYGIDRDAPQVSTPIKCQHCKRALVKPSTVLYGRSLPSSFFEAMAHDFPDNTDLVMVIGTSLTVGPANQVPALVGKTVPRIVMNMEPVGADLGIAYDTDHLYRENGTWHPRWSCQGRDYFLSGPCDDSVVELVKLLGWIDDLLQHKDELCPESKAKLEAIQ